MLGSVLEFFKEQDVEYTEHASLAELSYIKAGGTARVIASPKSIEDFVKILAYLYANNVSFKVVGMMSNTMSNDCEFAGVVIKTDKLNRKNIAEHVCRVECGARLSRVIWDAARFGLGGAEELFMIPAGIGGAVYNNAGAHGRAVSDIFLSGDVYSLRDNKVIKLTSEQMQFGYRHSLLKSEKYILLSAEIGFIPSDFSAVKEKITHYALLRRSSQPHEYPSLGSVFKRYNGVSAGYYIDMAGLKGFRIGGAEVSKKHAGFIVNVDNASASDITELISYVKHTVYNKFGIILEEEIEII